MAIPADRSTFTFNHSDQVPDYGKALGDYDQLQTNFDSRAVDLNSDINALKSALRSVLTGVSGADSIGRYSGGDAYGDTVASAIDTLIAAGAGSVPPDGTITTAKIADDAVTQAKIADDAVGNAQMVDDAVDTDEIVDDAVTADKIADSAVTPDKILGENITKTDSFILALTEANRFVMCSKTTAMTVTVPPNADVAFPIGTDITLCQYNTGVVTVAPGTAVTISSYDSNLDIDGQFSTATLRKVATDTWLLIGALA